MMNGGIPSSQGLGTYPVLVRENLKAMQHHSWARKEHHSCKLSSVESTHQDHRIARTEDLDELPRGEKVALVCKGAGAASDERSRRGIEGRHRHRAGQRHGIIDSAAGTRYYLRSISIGESLAYPPRLAVDLGSYVDGEAYGWARQPYGCFDPAPRPRDIIHTYFYR